MGVDGKMFSGVAELAMVGLAAIMIMIPVGIAGLLWFLWWAWNHVSIR